MNSKFNLRIFALLALCSMLFAATPGFAALSAERDTPSKAGQVFELGVATGVKIFKGALVAVNASGYATPGATATTLVGLGRADSTVDNTLGQNGDLNVRISRGIFRFANSADADAIANDDISKICYIVDDAAVALTNGSDTRSPAGRIFGIDSSGVWVEFLHFSAPGTVVSADIADGTIVAGDIAAGAITNAKVNASAAIAGSKLSPTFAGPAYPLFVVTTNNTAGVVTYSAAEVTGGMILRDPAGGSRSDVTPTAAAIVAAIPNAVVGSTFEFTIRNTADAAETITVTAGSGVTLSGTMTIAQNNSKRFLAICTNVTGSAEAVTIYSLGTVVH